MSQPIILGIGSGRCGTLSLARVLSQQPGVQVSHEEPPRLPWKRLPGERVIRERFARMRKQRDGRVLGDVVSFYLPYVEDAIAIEPGIRIVCLKRPREEVVESFCRWLDRVHPLPINHWGTKGVGNSELGVGKRQWYHEPNWTRIFPQYETQDREEGIRRYWDEYYTWVDELVGKYPQHIRVYDTEVALNTEEGLRDLLGFVGIAAGEQVLALGVRAHGTKSAGSETRAQRVEAGSETGVETGGGVGDPRRARAAATEAGTLTDDHALSGRATHPEGNAHPERATGSRIAQREKRRAGMPVLHPKAGKPALHPLDPRRCVVLVPFTGSIAPHCERALRELERRGYEVRRVGGYAAIDQGRNQMVTDGLIDGFLETFWIDADIEFHPDDVDRLRSHGLPIACGIYPQKGKRAIACHILPGTPRITFGREGGLVELLYAGAGFFHVRREVYETIQEKLALPMCNERFGSPMVPFFHPMLSPCEDGHWYLAEDYAFCERARQCGFRIVADTTVRLWHVGNYAYSWEDAGIDRERNAVFTLNFPEKANARR